MKTAVVNGVILDGTEIMTPVSGKTIAIENETITAITDCTDTTGYAVVDLKGQYILPGQRNIRKRKRPWTGF